MEKPRENPRVKKIHIYILSIFSTSHLMRKYFSNLS